MNKSKEHISFLWHQFIDEKATPNELEELFVHLKNHPDDEHSIALLQNQIANHQSTDTGDKEFWEEKLRQILETGQADNSMPAVYQASRVHFLKTTWFRYAAAIILIFGASAYFWITNKKTTQPLANGSKAGSAAPTNIAPGRDRAILTLANGQQILLDSIQGSIVQQGSLTVLNANGKLDYEGLGDNVEYHTLSTPKGGQYKLLLPDGTQVWLNTASSITYPTLFTGKNRSVSISGEAYFEVNKDAHKPFMVKTYKDEIVVLGTSFNVNSYKDEPAIKTSLLEGAVLVNGHALKPGEAYIKGTIITADLEQDLSWKKGFFNFNKLTIEQAMRQISRWYNVEVVYEKEVPQIMFWGKIERALSLNDMLKSLSKIGFHYRLENQRVIITP